MLFGCFYNIILNIEYDWKVNYKMLNKRYQIFISSTYDDLIDIRKKATKEILKMGHIPIGMELFNPDNAEQWKQIKRCIDESDYYIIIVGNKYGSLTKKGISYTEKEYNYALKKRIPIIRFIISDNAKISIDKSESDANKLIKLQKFKEKLKKRPVSFWKNADDFSTSLVQALTYYFEEYPQTGWIRDDHFVDPNALLNTGLKEYSDKALAKIRDSIQKGTYYDFYNRIITIEIDGNSNSFIVTVSNDIFIKNISSISDLYCPRPCFSDLKYAESYQHEIFEINNMDCMNLITKEIEMRSKNNQLPFIVKNSIDYSGYKGFSEMHIFHKFKYSRPIPYFYMAYQITLPCKNLQAMAKIQNSSAKKYRIIGLTASNYSTQRENSWKPEIYTDEYQCTINFGEWSQPGSGFMFYLDGDYTS